MIPEYQKALTSFIDAGDADYIGLWEVNTAARIILKIPGTPNAAQQQDVLRVSMDLVTLLLENGFIAIDLAEKGGYTAWAEQKPAAVNARIAQEWNALKGALPDVGFIVWFNKINKQPIKRA